MKLKSIVFDIACFAFLASCKKDKEDDKVEETIEETDTPTFSKNEITSTPFTCNKYYKTSYEDLLTKIQLVKITEFLLHFNKRLIYL